MMLREGSINQEPMKQQEEANRKPMQTPIRATSLMFGNQTDQTDKQVKNNSFCENDIE